jgi:hypothetical protein
MTFILIYRYSVHILKMFLITLDNPNMQMLMEEGVSLSVYLELACISFYMYSCCIHFYVNTLQSWRSLVGWLFLNIYFNIPLRIFHSYWRHRDGKIWPFVRSVLWSNSSWHPGHSHLEDRSNLVAAYHKLQARGTACAPILNQIPSGLLKKQFVLKNVRVDKLYYMYISYYIISYYIWQTWLPRVYLICWHQSRVGLSYDMCTS